MKTLLAFLLLLPALASADVLVRSCDAPGAGCTKWTWVLLANVKAAQVNRTGAPFVLLADVLPTERIAACYDDPGVAAGSSTVCAARVPGRSDLWQLKSVLYPATTSPGSISLTIDATNPRWDSGAPLGTNLLPDLYVRLYGAAEGQTLALLDAAPWASVLTFKRQFTDTARYCFAASLALDTTGDKIPDQESPQNSPWCGTPASPPPVLTLAPPNKITGSAP